MRTPRFTFFLPCVLLLTISSSQAELDPAKCQATVDAVVDLLEPYHSIQALREEKKLEQNSKATTPELRKIFDAHKILSVLPRLSMEPGYRLDFISHNTGLGRMPVFYARKPDVEPFASFAPLTNAIPQDVAKSKHEFWLACLNKGALSSIGLTFCEEKVRTDGTEEGFFQLVVLWLMGDQFIHEWHDMVHDDFILCTKDGLDQLFAEVDSGWKDPHWKIEAGVRQNARKLDLKPSMQMDKDQVTVHVVVFTKWGGFQRRSYVFHRVAPHRLITAYKKELVRYHCGWIY